MKFFHFADQAISPVLHPIPPVCQCPSIKFFVDEFIHNQTIDSNGKMSPKSKNVHCFALQ